MTTAFAPSYLLSRRAFLTAARAAGARVGTVEHPRRGIEQESLGVDWAWLGAADATHVCVVVSGTHGIEGYCGSAIQARLLEAEWRLAPHVALVALHALNPHGFSHGRRVDDENVDVNRNFIDFDAALPGNAAYALVHPFLHPADWGGPAHQAARAALAALERTHGTRWLRNAINAGQHSHPEGLFYGGSSPCWSRRTLDALLPRLFARAGEVALIDLHTGLGEPGDVELMHLGGRDPTELARLRDWHGPRVTSVLDGSTNSAPVQGHVARGVEAALTRAGVTSLVLEFGTRRFSDVVDAVLAEHWLHAVAGGRSPHAAEIRMRFRQAFLVDDTCWREHVIDATAAAVSRTLTRLGARRTCGVESGAPGR